MHAIINIQVNMPMYFIKFKTPDIMYFEYAMVRCLKQ